MCLCFCSDLKSFDSPGVVLIFRVLFFAPLPGYCEFCSGMLQDFADCLNASNS